MRLTEKQTQPSAVRRFTTATACALFCAGICASTLTLSVHVDAQAASDGQNPSDSADAMAVKPGIMVKQLVHKVSPVYPEDAKKAKIQGTVDLEAVIGKTGEVTHLKVLSGPKELQQSSLDAVKQWMYKPYLLNGEPVEVKTTVHIIYTLGNPNDSNPPPPPPPNK